MKALLAEKIEMSQVFDTAGAVRPVTFLRVLINTVTAVRKKEKDGYDAIQVSIAGKKSNQPRLLREFRGDFGLNKGEIITAEVFQEGDVVLARGVSKGKGFQGTVKRHGFKGGPRTHGQKHSEREPGSIGAVWPQRVLKGMRMSGRMGGDRVTVRNLNIVKIFASENILAVGGAVPGHRGSIIEIREQKFT